MLFAAVHESPPGTSLPICCGATAPAAIEGNRTFGGTSTLEGCRLHLMVATANSLFCGTALPAWWWRQQSLALLLVLIDGAAMIGIVIGHDYRWIPASRLLKSS